MEESTTGRKELASRLQLVEEELRALRAAVEQQSNSVSQLHTQLVQAQPPSGARRQNGNDHGLRHQLSQRMAEWYMAGARTLLRADVEDLFDRGYYRQRTPALSNNGSDPVFHFLRAESPVSPHWLFDRDYYLRTYPDVAAAKVNPLVHFLRTGWREGRNPHPLFRTEYYLEQVPELKSGKLNPVTHYLQSGAALNLNPHPLFDTAFYLQKYPDIAHAGMNPLTHYVLFGAAESRQPHPWFDPAFYRQRNPDVAEARVETVQHYLEHGAAEWRDPHPLFDTGFYQEEYAAALSGMTALEHYVRVGQKQKFVTLQTNLVERFLPAAPLPPLVPRGRMVDVIVPVYRGLAETRACIESALESLNREPFELIVIDDLSPERELSEHLRQASGSGKFTLLENPVNLGFVATVNRGMQLHPDRDVVLLNSDTTVANDWLDRLVRCAYGPGHVGTVTPFSNNATICSYPKFCEENPIPAGITAAELDRLAAKVNAGRSVQIPTAVGFCMYIRRDCLEQTGLFDVDTFGKGYGEENDFSLRAANKGWRNVLAADTFVYHAGSVSFAKGANLLRGRGVRAVTERHPKYPGMVSRHVSRDAALPYRFALMAASLRHSPNPTVLIITHNLGGGVGQHIEELVESLTGKVNFLELQPARGSVVLLKTAEAKSGFTIRLDLSEQYEALIALLKSCNVSRIHVHHVLGHPGLLEKLRNDLCVPLDFTVHDYTPICPRFVLADPAGRYCGEPDESGCNECIRATLPHLHQDIGSWRAKYSWLMNSAERVITPSVDAATRMSRHFPMARIHAATHPSQLPAALRPAVQARKLDQKEPLRIGVLGVMSRHKGLHNLETCAQIAKEQELPLEFVLIGYSEPQIRGEGPFTFQETGEYALPDLPGILAEQQPALIWFPMRWPETFSYTLTVCLDQALPVAAPALGALPERLGGRPWTWIYDWAFEPDDLIELFLGIRQSLVSGAPPRVPAVRAQADPDFYREDYRAGALRSLREPLPHAIDLREPGRLSVVALLSSYDSGQLQPCGYIRAYLPLMHERAESLLRLTVTSPESALHMIADVLLVQRTAVPNLSLAEDLLRHCERHGIRIVYETDDDLFNIHEGHADSGFYTPLLASGELIARQAAAVVVSTPLLKQRLSHLNHAIHVIPNALDEELWFQGSKPFRAASKEVRILYMGTMTHSKDLELLEEPMRLLKEEFGPAVQLDLIGIMPDHRQREWFNMIPVPGIYGHSYPLFAGWLRKENKWDIGVAPLVDNEFNRCKSYIKYLDYAALGLPGIYSSIGVFDQVVKQGETGLLVPDAAAWYDAMRLLITDVKLRRAMGAAAYRDVQANYTLAAQANLRRELWNQIGSRPAVRSSSTIVSFSEETTAVSSNGI